MPLLQTLRRALRSEVGIDLGTANSLIYLPGQGIVLREPSVVALRGDRILAVGTEAKEMLGKTPAAIRAVRPLREGVIADFDVTQAMIRHFLRRVRPWSLTAPQVIVGVPQGITEVERRAVREAVLQAGAARVYLLDECLAASVGAGLAVAESTGRMCVSIGGGTTQAAVISLADVVVSRVSRVAGDALDTAITAHFEKNHAFLIGERTAELVKIHLGSALPPAEAPKPLEIRGRDLWGLPRSIQIRPEEVREAIEGPVAEIIRTVRECLEAAPPELAADIVGTGVLLVGGTAMLRGLPERIAQETGMSVHVADAPLDVVAVGAGHALDTLALVAE